MNNGLKDIAQLVALIVADLKEVQSKSVWEREDIHPWNCMCERCQEELIQRHKHLDPKAPVWGKVDERIDREWDRNDD